MVLASDAPFGMSSADVPMLVLFGMGGLIWIVWIVFKNIADIYKTKQIQETRRELAAFVASGAITPDDAVRLLSTDSSDIEKMIHNAVEWGTITPEKATQLIKQARSADGQVARPATPAVAAPVAKP